MTKKKAKEEEGDKATTPSVEQKESVEIIQAEETLEPIKPEEVEVTDPTEVTENSGDPKDVQSKYFVDEEKIDAYLNGIKPNDTVAQISKGGNFVSTKDRTTIYIPLNLIKK